MSDVVVVVFATVGVVVVVVVAIWVQCRPVALLHGQWTLRMCPLL